LSLRGGSSVVIARRFFCCHCEEVLLLSLRGGSSVVIVRRFICCHCEEVLLLSLRGGSSVVIARSEATKQTRFIGSGLLHCVRNDNREDNGIASLALAMTGAVAMGLLHCIRNERMDIGRIALRPFILVEAE